MFSRVLGWLRGEPPANDPDEREAFVLRLGVMVQAVDPSTTYDAERDAFIGTDGTCAFVGNHWDRYRTAPEAEREGVLLDTARIIVSLGEDTAGVPDSWAEAAPNLRPRLRPRHMYETLALRSRATGANAGGLAATLRPLRGDLHVELAYDQPTSIQNVRPERLLVWGIEQEAAFERAVANLDRETPPGAFAQVSPGVYACEVGDCYDSSRVVLVDRIRALPVRGSAVALPANRDTLWITGDEDEDGLRILLQIAAKALDLPRLDTAAPVVLGVDGWSGWVPPEDHPQYAEWCELVVLDQGTAYSAIKAGLEPVHEREGVDVFVASFGAIVIDGVPRSHAVWSDVPTWLPRTQLVTVSRDEAFLLVPRDALDAEAGHLLTPVPDVFPPFDAVTGGIPEAEFERLRAHAVDP
ncbi:MAG: hypothetical protein ACI8PZ_002378 [Myxococcota bacterium]|jgi:hypothetical protein